LLRAKNGEKASVSDKNGEKIHQILINLLSLQKYKHILKLQ